MHLIFSHSSYRLGFDGTDIAQGFFCIRVAALRSVEAELALTVWLEPSWRPCLREAEPDPGHWFESKWRAKVGWD